MKNIKKAIISLIFVMLLGIIYDSGAYADSSSESRRTYQTAGYLEDVDGNTNDNSNDNENILCWIGWKDIHFGPTTPTSKKGDLITFKKPMIVNGQHTGDWTTEAITSGYGHYAFDFSKHMLGLLSYMKTKVSDYPTEYVPIYDQPEFDADGNLIEPSAVSMRTGISITIDKLLRTWYSKDYEENEFRDFWTKSFIATYQNELRKLQNRFYWGAYGSEAFNKLTAMMNSYGNSYFNRLSSEQKAVLKGVVFSIMEARYRNKNLQGKSNLKVKAAEGDLGPFLVYLKNLDKISRTGNDSYTYIDKDTHNTHYEFPPFDELIDGAYLWMQYYDSEALNSTTHSTITSIISNESSGEEIEIDWESEYYTLTNEPLKVLRGKSLEEFYNKCYLVRNIFKKSKENTEGIFGAEELYDITSDINFSEAISNMQTAMISFATEVGGELSNVFNGLNSDHIARTYIMARNIVEANRIQDEYAYYNVGTNIISYTPGNSSDEFMLVDFQKIKLKSPLKVNHIDTYIDSDGDGIYDRNELGDEASISDKENTMKRKVDITGFIKKMVERELYGNDSQSINDNQDYIKEVVAKVKYNIVQNRNHFDAENSENNKLNWKEVYENNLNIDEKTRNELKIESGDTAKIQYLKLTPSKLEVELWKYKSNPVLKDTDFDGIDDGLGAEKLREIEEAQGITEESSDIERKNKCKNIRYDMLKKDAKPNDNHFTGRINSTRISGIDGLEVAMNMDYRYFFLSNKMYYDELSTMSLLYANSVYMQNSGISVYSDNNPSHSNLKIKELMKFYGFKNVKTYYMGTSTDDGYEEGDICRNYHKKDTHKGRVALGYKTILYNGIYKNVIGIVIRGTAEDDDWDSDFDMGDLKLRNEILSKSNVKKGKENNTIEPMVIDGSTKNSRVIDLYFNHNQVLGYDKKYYNDLKHFAYGYPDWTNEAHHAGFDIAANRILEVVNEYYNEVKDYFNDEIEVLDNNTIETAVTANSVRDNSADIVDGGVCFWVTGHSMGGGVANLVAANLIDRGYKDRVYCYTFAAPNTFYKTDNNKDNYKEPHGVKYRSIFNITNADDFVPAVPMKDCNWTKYGRTASVSFNSNKANIESAVRNQDKNLWANYQSSATKRYINDTYKGNPETIRDIVKSFNDIFEKDPDNMRYDAYTFTEEDKIVSRNFYTNPIIPQYTKPFQKIMMNANLPAQYQMPAYFMQYIAYCMHGGFPLIFADSSDVGFFFANLAKKYINTKDALIGRKDLMVSPHYLETYYLLTKKIVSVDFK